MRSPGDALRTREADESTETEIRAVGIVGVRAYYCDSVETEIGQAAFS
ncbi:MAG: hypothetical protein ACPL7K_07805 [Armatimonadota bacterium]